MDLANYYYHPSWITLKKYNTNNKMREFREKAQKLMQQIHENTRFHQMSKLP